MPFLPLSQVKTSPTAPAAARPGASAAAIDLRITGMHCASCVASVERALGTVPGVAQASVNLATERAHVRLAAPVAPERLAEAVRAAGYGVRPVTGAVPDDAEQRERAAELAGLSRRFVVAAALALPVVRPLEEGAEPLLSVVRRYIAGAKN